MISKEELAELDRLAKAATPGPWEYDGATGVDYDCAECGEEFPESGYRVVSKDKHQALELHLFGMERFAKPDGSFIAYANPERVQRLVERVLELEEEVQHPSSRWSLE